MMSKSEQLVYSVLGLIKSNILPVTYTLDFLVELIFRKKIPVSEIMITKMVYPHVAQRLNKSVSAVERSVERLIHDFWTEALKQKRISQFFGHPSLCEPSVSEILYYLSFFLYYDRPFFHVLDDLSDLNSSSNPA